MKLLIRQYLASLKERGELDAILPDLLSELGFHVYSRPQRGTTQHGVDVAAIGRDDSDGEEKVFLFSLKSGDLTRKDWNDGSPQSLRPSLDSIKDAYIPTRIPPEYANRKIVICLCFGGDLHEQAQDDVRGYTRRNQTDQISYQEWGGERLAGLILQGILREDILPKQHRSSFQKAVAMVDSPDVAFRYFSDLTLKLTKSTGDDLKAQISAVRQLYICLWVLFVWARDSNNVEAPYRASELAVLRLWELCRVYVGSGKTQAEAIFAVLNQTIQLHLTISLEFLERKILPHVSKQDAIASAIATRSSVDINQGLFDLLGRIAMAGLWLHWLHSRTEEDGQERLQEQISNLATSAFKMIDSNPALLLPLSDDSSIEVAMTLLLAAYSRTNRDNIQIWLGQMAGLLDFTVRTHGKYTCTFKDYRFLIDHPRERTDEYRKEATSGSTLIPLLVAWLGALGDQKAVSVLVELKRNVLDHCTLQLWLPDKDSEGLLFTDEDEHGVALSDLPIELPFEKYAETIADACRNKNALEQLSAIVTDHWPIVLLACRHYRNPVPPHFWINLLWQSPSAASATGNGSNDSM